MSNVDGKDGGSAFPIVQEDMNVDGGPGMTLRDYFAAAALTGMMQAGGGGRYTAEVAYQLADDMLAERDR